MLTLSIKQDEDPQSPWEWEESICFFSNCRRELSSHNTPGDQGFPYYADNAKNMAGALRAIRLDLPGEGWSLFPVRAYIHSGIALSLGNQYPFNDEWDSGLGGILAVNPLKMGFKKGNTKAAKKAAESFIETLNQYHNGEVYGYAIADENGDHLDSCWGFYGHEYCEQEGKTSLEWHEKDRAKKAAEHEADLSAVWDGVRLENVAV